MVEFAPDPQFKALIGEVLYFTVTFVRVVPSAGVGAVQEITKPPLVLQPLKSSILDGPARATDAPRNKKSDKTIFFIQTTFLFAHIVHFEWIKSVGIIP
jgi:hypothetical protein